MRTIILITAFVCYFTNVFSQQQTYSNYSWITPTSLPYYGGNNDGRSGVSHGFAYWMYGSILQSNVFKDIGLTVEEAEDPVEGWSECAIYRTFTPTNGNYRLLAASLGCMDYGKSMLIAITDNGNYIDAINISAVLGFANGDYAFPMQWSITTDMKVTVYQLKPTSRTALMFNANITFPLQAQRIDRTYQISSTGQFSLLSTKLYQPKTYPLSSFTDRDYKIRDGNETPLP